MELSSTHKLANLTFSSLYLFSVNEKGKITTLKKLRDNFVGEETVKECVSNWKLSGFPDGAKFTVYFYWKHGKGWVEQKISGNGLVQVMSLEDTSIEKLIEKPDLSKNVTKP